ncbi:hypothetical protein J6590_054927 [Homalodisca vitripennis]|nr:hypothetical protein J6590_054927 [Homalodisca vitripennis]
MKVISTLNPDYFEGEHILEGNNIRPAANDEEVNDKTLPLSKNTTTAAILELDKLISDTLCDIPQYYLTLRRTRLCTFPPLFFRSINTLPAQFQSSCEAS